MSQPISSSKTILVVNPSTHPSRTLCVHPSARSPSLLDSAVIRFNQSSVSTIEANEAIEATTGAFGATIEAIDAIGATTEAIEAIEATIDAIGAIIEASIGASHEAAINVTLKVIGAIKSTNDSPACITASASS